MLRPVLVATLLLLAACLGDPVGPGGLVVLRRFPADVDSLLVGAPGRPLPEPVTFQAVDGDGRPIPGAAVRWTVVGANGRVEQAAATTDAEGRFGAVWVLGTRASEQQQLTARVDAGKHTGVTTLAATAKPVEVAAVSFRDETTTVKVGVPTRLAIQATDPFGNRFTPPASLTALDTAFLGVDTTGNANPRRRGFSRVVVRAAAATDTAWVHGIQVVRSIIAQPDTLLFHALGQTQLLQATLIDDQGHEVVDSLPDVGVALTTAAGLQSDAPVPTVVDVQAGKPLALRSVSEGSVELILRAGTVDRQVAVRVKQRVATLKLTSSAIHLDALRDTVRLGVQLSDSLGAPVAGRTLTYRSSDTTVASVAPDGLVTSTGSGSAWLSVRTARGVADSVEVTVAQRVARVVVVPDSLLFDALQAVQPIRASALDRLGSPVAGASVTYGVRDAALASVDSGGNVRALGNGATVVTATAGEVSAPVVVRVAQRPVRLVLPSDTVHFDALGQDQTITAVALDSLGSPLGGGVTNLVVAEPQVVERVDSATVRAKANGVTKASFTVAGFPGQVVLVVGQSVASVAMPVAALSFDALNDTVRVTPTVQDRLGAPLANAQVSFSSTDTSVAVVDANGLVTARGNGTATVVAQAIPGVTGSVQVSVNQRVARITVAQDTLRFEALQAVLPLGAVARDRLGSPVTGAAVTYATGNGAVGSVDASGTVRAVGNGQTVMMAATAGVTAAVVVQVAQRPVRLVMPSDTVHFDALGQDQAITAVALDSLGSPLSAGVTNVAVADAGVVEAIDAVTVRAKANGVTKASFAVAGVPGQVVLVVGQRAASVAMPAALSSDALNDTMRVTPTVQDRLGAPLTNPPVSFSSTDPSVAVVDAGGLITVRGNGAATVVAQAGPGVTGGVLVSVKQRVVRITVVQDTLRFDALQAVLPLGAVARDRLGSPVTGAAVTYATGNGAVASVDSSGTVRSLGNGATVVTVAAAGDSTTGVAASATIVVQQRITAITVAPGEISFDAVGDTLSLGVTARDSLGSAVTGATLDYLVSDSAIVALRPGMLLRSVGQGKAAVTVRDPASGTTGTVDLSVNQVPKTLTVAVAFGAPVVTLPVGAPLLLACQVLDKNGFPIAQNPAFVGSVRGTVTGSGCDDARVQHSGYDTLFFALGALQARVPVIVATAPDSVGVVAAAQPLTTVTRDLYVGENLTNPLILALRPLVGDILAAYGNPTTNLDRARAIRDWLSRTAVHPYRRLHPDGSTSNLSVLPPGKAWADVNPVSMGKINDDTQFWGVVGLNGYAMLDRLLGTLDPSTGRRADDGMMVKVEGARYRIRDIATYRYVLCSYQDVMVNTLWAAAGLQGMLISTVGHDPAAVFIPELGRWVYEDPEWNEEYLLDGAGQPLAPTDLLALTSAGSARRLRAAKLPGPGFDPEVYVAGDTYTNYSNGFLIMGSQLNNRVAGVVVPGVGSWPMRYVQIDVPQLLQYSPWNDPVRYDRVAAAVAFPTLGVVVQGLQVQDSVYVVQLSSTFPNHQHFERRLNGGEWENVAEVDVLPVGQCRMEYRSVDSVGDASGTTVLDVWVPRAAEFIEAGVPGGVRRQARFCI